MSEAKVRWAVAWRFKDGAKMWWCGDLGWQAEKQHRLSELTPHCAMLGAAHQFNKVPMGAIVRLVKLTRRAKGWRPASELPKRNLDVLARLTTDALRTMLWNGKDWVSSSDGRQFAPSVTHWRTLPAGPK